MDAHAQCQWLQTAKKCTLYCLALAFVHRLHPHTCITYTLFPRNPELRKAVEALLPLIAQSLRAQVGEKIYDKAVKDTPYATRLNRFVSVDVEELPITKLFISRNNTTISHVDGENRFKLTWSYSITDHRWRVQG
jgi:hypothetical protein